MAEQAHGGARAGAGRPAKAAGERAVSHSIRLLPATLALLERLCEATGKTQRELVTEALALYAKKTATVHKTGTLPR